MILISELLFIVVLQTTVEALLDTEKREKQIKVINVACVAVSYLLLVRYVYNHLWGELLSFVNFPF